VKRNSRVVPPSPTTTQPPAPLQRAVTQPFGMNPSYPNLPNPLIKPDMENLYRKSNFPMKPPMGVPPQVISPNPFLLPPSAASTTTTTTTNTSSLPSNSPFYSPPATNLSTRITENDLKKLLDNQCDELPERDPPNTLLVNLFSYQKQCLHWMSKKETDSSRGGILADDMGVGKTVETLSCMLTNPRTKGAQKNLIVCPVSLVYHWKREIQTKSKTTLNKIYVYHGPSRERDPKAIAKYDVVITTYNTLASEYELNKVTNEINYGPLLQVKWFRVILDEVNCL
jgi:SNF2 family DNA or RNA helicase